MSGVAGADRVKSRLDFKQFLSSYQHLLGQFPGFVSMTPSGSYNSNPDKQDFGDIDLIVHIQSDKDKATLKKELQAFFTRQPDTVIVPFSSAKHAGKRTYNAGELVSVRYHDDALGYSAQIDNIVALDHLEASFKQAFLDMPAEEQGLVLGLVKIATIETEPAILFQKLGINAPTQLEPDQEYEFNLSGVELQLRKVTYEPGTYKQLSRDIVWNSKNFDDLQKLLYQYDLKAGFDSLLQQSKQNIRNPRSNARMQGVFSSMISVKSGEVGTPKGAGKEAALARVQQAFGESRNKSVFRSLMENNNRKVVFAFGRFQPPTIGHELLINRVKQTAEHAGAAHAIYVSKTQDHKTNPLAVDQKIAYLRKMFPGTTFVAADATVRTPIEAAKHLNQTYNELIMVAGSDRAPSFENLLNTYNGKDFNYQTIQVVSSGERDPDSDEVSGMSGTKMREAAVANDFQTFRQGLPASLSDDDAMNLMNLVRTGLTKPVKVKEEAGSQLSIQQLASISDEALDNAYHYGRSTPGNSFGWQANLKSAEYAKQMIDAGVTDIEKIGDGIHKGWNVTAQAFVQNPDQFDDTAKLNAAGKLEAKLQQRAQLMKQNYAQLPNDEQEKDRVVARALLQAIRGTQSMGTDLQDAVDPESDIYLESVIAELSSEKLGQYKKAAGTQASAADKAGDTKKADKRFSGIVKATKKQFANDEKGVEETSIFTQVSLPKWQIGLTVFVKHLGQKGEIASLGNDSAIVDVGMRQYRVPLDGLKRYPSQGVAEADMNRRGFLKGIGAATAAGAAGAAGAGDFAGSVLRGAGGGMASGAAGKIVYKDQNEADMAFADKIPDEWDKIRYTKAVKSIIRSRGNSVMRYMGSNSTATRGSIMVDEKQFNRLKTELSQKYNIPMDQVKEQGVAEGAPIVVMPSPERLKKAEPTKVRYQGDIVPPTKPPSTEKRGVKGRPGQRPMPDQGVAEGKYVPVSEGVENLMKTFINKIIVNEAIQNNKR